MNGVRRNSPFMLFPAAGATLLLAACLGGGGSGGGGGGGQTAEELQPPGESAQDRLIAAASAPADLSSHDAIAKRWLLVRELGLFLDLPTLLPGEFLHPILFDELSCDDESQLELLSDLDVERDPDWFGDTDLQEFTFLFDDCSLREANGSGNQEPPVNQMQSDPGEEDLVPIDEEVLAASRVIDGRIAITTLPLLNTPMLESLFRVQAGLSPDGPWRFRNIADGDVFDYRIHGDVRAMVRNGFRWRRGQHSVFFIREQGDEPIFMAYLAISGPDGGAFDLFLQPEVRLLRSGAMEIAIDLQAAGEEASCPAAGRFVLETLSPVATADPDGGGGITGGELTFASPGDVDPADAVQGTVNLFGTDSFVVTIDGVAQEYDQQTVDNLAPAVSQCLFD